VRGCRLGAALFSLCVGLALAAASASGQPSSVPTVRAPDAGVPHRARDAGLPALAAPGDGGARVQPWTLEDLEVVENLELLEHLPESDVLDLLLPLRDE